MKSVIDSSEFNVETAGDFEVTQFQQRNNAESFQVLSSDIYKHPILAIIRELSANAVDAHVVGKNTKQPYIIHTPTTFAPHWRIRDFGTGIEPSKIKTVYTVYFESDKRNNNDTIGEKGLGSKTPFAYTDNFTIINYYKGKRYCYTAFKDDDGLPCLAIAKDGISDTNEHDGLEVTFAVEQHDHYQFKSYLSEALKFFKFKPKLEGAHVDLNYNPEYIIQTAEFGVLNKKDTSYLVMGNIGYPIEVSAFEGTKEALDKRETKLLNYGIHLFVPIGSPVRTIASREALNYTPNTRAFIKKIIKKAVEAVEAEANRELANAKTVWEARSYFGKVRNGVIGQICDLENTHFVNWQGKKISDVVSLNDFDKAEHPSILEMLEVKQEGARATAATTFWYNNDPDDPDGEVINSGNGIRRWEISSFAADSTKLVFENDMERGGYAAAARHMQEYEFKRAILIAGATDKFVKKVGFGHLIVKTSSIPKPERKKREYYKYGSKERTLLQKITDNGLENCEVEVSRGGIYVEVRRDKIKWYPNYGSKDHKFLTLDDRYWGGNYRTISDYIEQLKTFGYGVDNPIYAIRPCDMGRINRYKEKWVPLHQCMAEALSSWEALLPTLRLAATDVDTNISQFSTFDLAKGSVATETIELIDSCLAAKIDPMVRAFTFLNDYVKMYDIKPVDRVQKQQKLFYEEYPLLQYVDINKNSKPEIETYISMIDQARSNKKRSVA